MRTFSFQKTLNGPRKRFPLSLPLLQSFHSCWQESIILATGAFRRGNEIALNIAVREHAAQEWVNAALAHQTQPVEGQLLHHFVPITRLLGKQSQQTHI